MRDVSEKWTANKCFQCLQVLISEVLLIRNTVYPSTRTLNISQYCMMFGSLTFCLLFAQTVDQPISRPWKWKNKSIHRLVLSGSTGPGGAAAPCTPASYSSAILTLRWKLFLCRSSIAAAMSLTFLEISASLRFIFSLRHQHAWSQTRVCGSINFFNFSTSLMTFASSCFSSTFS